MHPTLVRGCIAKILRLHSQFRLCSVVSEGHAAYDPFTQQVGSYGGCGADNEIGRWFSPGAP